MTRSGWLKLGALAFVVLVILFIICAPLATLSVRIDLPPATARPEPTTAASWLMVLAWMIGALSAVALLIGLIVVSIWLVVRTARKIIEAQPKEDI